MRRLLLLGCWATLAAFLLPSLASAAELHPWVGYGQVRESGGVVPFTTATAVGTCLDGGIMVDVNGVVRCGADTTTDPSDVIVRSGACYELDGTCTAPDLLLAGGIDTKQYTGITQANCGTDTITVTVINNAGTSTANALVEGTDWDCLTDDNTCATALAAAIDALTGVSSQSSTNTVGVRPDDSTIGVTLASSDATCATAANGTDGVVGMAIGTKLVFDTDADANNYITSSADNTMEFYNEGTLIFRTTASGLGLLDNGKQYFGSGLDYWIVYSSANTAFELNSTNCDGGGTDCTVLTVDDGTDDAAFNGDVTLKIGERLVFDADGTANDYISATADGTIRFYINNAQSYYIDSAGMVFLDTKKIHLGTGRDYTLDYTSGTFTLGSSDCDGGGTDCTVLSVDDGDAILDLRNDEFLHNETDGKITLGGAGGTFNEDIIFDFDVASNFVRITSGTGATVFDLTAGGWEIRADDFRVDSGNRFYFTNSTELVDPANGQLTLRQSDDSTGATLDVLTANTVTIKDQAGTGNGNLTVTGTTTKSGAEVSHFVSIDADNTPYTVLATDLGIVCDPDSGGTPGDVTISLPASAGAGRRVFVKNIGTTYDCLVDPNGTEQIDASGAGTAVTVDTKASLTIKDVGVSTFEWVIE